MYENKPLTITFLHLNIDCLCLTCSLIMTMLADLLHY